MQITLTTNGGVQIYQQLVDTPDRMNAVVSHLMAEPRGDKFSIVVSNNGHTLSFTTDTIDITALVKCVNGIGRRTKAQGA